MSAQKLNLQRSALEHHKQVGKELIPPFQQIGPPMEQVFWLRDLLPEFLWIDALVHEYGQPTASQILNDFLTDADRFNSHPKEILDGTIGSFRFIAEGQRKTFVEELSVKINRAVAGPLRHVLSLYPECPMKWMAPDESADRDPSIAIVRDAVGRLYAGKEAHVRRRVIEPAHLAEHEIAVILEARVPSNPHPQLDEFVKNLLALFRILQPALRNEF